MRTFRRQRVEGRFDRLLRVDIAIRVAAGMFGRFDHQRRVRKISKGSTFGAGSPAQDGLAVFAVRKAEPSGSATGPFVSEAAPRLAALVFAVVLEKASRTRSARQFDNRDHLDGLDDFLVHPLPAPDLGCLQVQAGAQDRNTRSCHKLRAANSEIPRR